MWNVAIVIGFAGSLHCLGMCSPLAMAVTNWRKPIFANRLVYNLGRIFCYGLLGAVASSFGSLFSLSGFQNILTITLGCVMIVIGLTGVSRMRVPILTALMEKVTLAIKGLFTKFIPQKTILSMAVMGMLNGLLPCGLTYLALTYCLTLTEAYSGFLFMLVFGAGTLPVMLGFTSVLQGLINRFRFSIRSFTTVTMIMLGVLLVTRSMYVHYHGDSDHQLASPTVICK